jgi:hypothetical protein
MIDDIIRSTRAKKAATAETTIITAIYACFT